MNCKKDPKKDGGKVELANAEAKSNVFTAQGDFYKKVLENNPSVNDLIAKRQINLSQSTIDIGRAFAIGKSLYSIDKRNYGVSQKVRDAGGDIIPNSSNEDLDPFRLVSGKYWAMSDDEKSLVYLNAPGIKHQIIDYSFSKSKVTLTDIKMKDSPIKTSTNSNMILNYGVFEKILSNLVSISKSQEERTVLSTQQAILISPNKEYFLDKLANQEPQSKIISQPNGLLKKIDSIQETGFSTLASIGGIKDTSKFNQIQSKQYSNIGEVKGVANQSSLVKELSLVESSNATNFVGGTNKITMGSGNSISQQSEFAIGNKQTSIKDFTYNPNLWKSYVDSMIVSNVDYYDYSFEMPLPFMKKEVNTDMIINKPLIVDCKFEYVYYVKEYEEKMKNALEVDLPNFYVFGIEMSKEKTNVEYQKMITLGGAMNIRDAIIIPPSRTIDYRKINEKYFRTLAFTYGTMVQSVDSISEIRLQEKQLVNRKNKNIGISIDNIEALEKYYNLKVMFPMYVDLQFSTDKTTVVSNILHDCKLDTSFMKDVLVNNASVYKNLDFVESVETLSESNSENGGKIISKGFSLSSNGRRVWDITQWLLDVDSREETIVRDGLMLYTNDEKINEQENEIVKSIMRIVLVGKMKRFLKDNFRKYEDMMNGKLCYSETMMYRIEKSLVDDKGNKIGEPIQNYYISNGNEIEIMKFVDTQIKYNTRYRYDVYAYQVVLGTKYKYVDKVIANDSATFSVIQVPSVIVVEVPYFNYTDILIDSPPVRPDVRIIPYKGINDKILFFLNGNVGDYEEIPIVIDSSDKEKIDNYRKAKKLSVNDKIRYRSDDHASIFQIYRTDTKPKTYFDFSGKLLATVETDVSNLTAQSATSAAYVDSIKPNVKYWYCFRAVDNHNHLSQPTDIFQVEMVDDHGMVYPVVETFDMDKEKENIPISKPMRRYIYIAPTMLQSLIDEEESELSELDTVKDYDATKIKLGIRDKTVWGQEYKIRFTSKKTGRKFDLNLNCSYEGVKRK